MLKILRFLKPYTTQVIFILLLMFMQTLSDLYLPTLMAKLVDVGIVNGDRSYIIHTGAFMLLVAAGGALSSICASFLSSRTSLGMARKFREKVFTRVESFSLNEFNKLGTSTLIIRTTNDITQIQQVVVMMLRMMLGRTLCLRVAIRSIIARSFMGHWGHPLNAIGRDLAPRHLPMNGAVPAANPCFLG